jgi:hypothetical protein
MPTSASRWPRLIVKLKKKAGVTCKKLNRQNKKERKVIPYSYRQIRTQGIHLEFHTNYILQICPNRCCKKLRNNKLDNKFSYCKTEDAIFVIFVIKPNKITKCLIPIFINSNLSNVYIKSKKEFF